MFFLLKQALVGYVYRLMNMNIAPILNSLVLNMKKLMIAIATAAALSGCAQQTFKINNGIAEKPTQEVKQSFFVNGIGQSQTIDAALVCGSADKVVRTEVQETGMDVFLRIVTLGIYTPREARVYCAK